MKARRHESHIHNMGTMIRIAISVEAFEAIARTLPLGNVGYKPQLDPKGEVAISRLRALRSDLIEPTIAVHHGRVVKRTGDGAIVEFRSVVDAVNCAIEIQRAMVERNAG